MSAQVKNAAERRARKSLAPISVTRKSIDVMHTEQEEEKRSLIEPNSWFGQILEVVPAFAALMRLTNDTYTVFDKPNSNTASGKVWVGSPNHPSQKDSAVTRAPWQLHMNASPSQTQQQTAGAAAVDDADHDGTGNEIGQHDMVSWVRSPDIRSARGSSDDICIKVLRDMQMFLRSSDSSLQNTQLLEHLNSCFDKNVLAAASGEKCAGTGAAASYQPKYSLDVTLHDATRLMGKDADGTSDPYCILDVVPQAETAELMHRLSQQLDSRRMSSVVEGTTDPVWEELFQLSVGDSTTMAEYSEHKLVIVLWDKDDNSNEKISSVAGAGRMLKDKYRRGMKGEPDSFLGVVEIPLDKVPRDGVHGFNLPMQKRSSRSNVSGSVNVSLSWSNKVTPPSGLLGGQDPSNSNQVAALVYGYAELIRSSARQDVFSDVWWNGSCSAETMLLLNEYRFHLGLKDVHVRVSEWIILMEKCAHSVESTDFEYVSATLSSLIQSAWQASPNERHTICEALDKALDFSVMLALQIVEHTFVLLKEDGSNADQMNAANKYLSSLPSVYANIDELQDRRSGHETVVAPLTPECIASNITMRDEAAITFRCHEAVMHALEERARNLWDRVCKNVPEKSGDAHSAMCCTALAKLMMHDLLTIEKWYQMRHVHSYRVAVAVFDGRISAHTEEMLTMAASQVDSGQGIDEGLLMAIFDLYFAIKAFLTADLPMRLTKLEIARLRLSGFQVWFEPFVIEWIRVSELKGVVWARRAVEAAVTKHVSDADSSHIVCSTAVLDVFRILYAAIDVYEKLDVGSFSAGMGIMFTAQFTECVCRILREYADAEYERASGLLSEHFELSELACSGVNNMVTAINELDTIHQRLNVLDIQQKHSEQFEAKEVNFEHSPTTLLVKDVKVYVQMRHNKLCEQMTKQVGVNLSQEIKKGVARMKSKLAQDLEVVDEITDPILDQLDESLFCTNEYLYSEVTRSVHLRLFNQVLLSMYECCLGLGSSPGVVADLTKFQMNMMALMTRKFEDFFTDDIYDLCREQLTHVQMYAPVNRVMRWANYDSAYLICEYYRQLARHPPEQTTFGLLNISVWRTVQSGQTTLHVNLMKAQNLPGMDKNGTSDPYVSLAVIPHAATAGANPQKSTSKRKILNPVWDESFQFKIADTDAVLVLQLFDWNRFSAADPIGEAVVDIVETEEVAKNLVLTLTRQAPNDKSPAALQELWKLWEIRCKTDELADTLKKRANDFYSNRHTVYHSSPSVNRRKNFIVDL